LISVGFLQGAVANARDHACGRNACFIVSRAFGFHQTCVHACGTAVLRGRLVPAWKRQLNIASLQGNATGWLNKPIPNASEIF